MTFIFTLFFNINLFRTMKFDNLLLLVKSPFCRVLLLSKLFCNTGPWFSLANLSLFSGWTIISSSKDKGFEFNHRHWHWSEKMISFPVIRAPGPPVGSLIGQGRLKEEYHCTIDLLIDWFGISCMTSDNLCFLFALQTNPNQSNRRSMVQWYFLL